MNNREKHLLWLKGVYSGFSLSLRKKAIEDRLKYPDSSPNILILEVSATEGIARTILISFLLEKGFSQKTSFKIVSSLKVLEVFKMIYEIKGIKLETHVSQDDWKEFKYAIAYRNFLIHHCAYLNGRDAGELIEATKRVRNQISAEWL